MSRLRLVLVLVIISHCYAQLCYNQSSSCDYCQVRCSNQVPTNGSCDLSWNTSGIFINRANNVKENLTFKLDFESCRMGTIDFYGVAGQPWNINFESLQGQSLLSNAQLSFSYVNNLIFDQIQFLYQNQSRQNMITLSNINKFQLTGNAFKSVFYKENREIRLIQAENSNLFLNDVPIVDLNFTKSNNIFFLKNTSLTMSGNVVNISNNNVYGPLIFGESYSSVSIIGSDLQMNSNYVKEGIFQISDCDKFNINMSNSIQIMNNLGYTETLIFNFNQIKVSIYAKNLIYFVSNTIYESKRFMQISYSSFDIRTDGQILFTNIKGIAFYLFGGNQLSLKAGKLISFNFVNIFDQSYLFQSSNTVNNSILISSDGPIQFISNSSNFQKLTYFRFNADLTNITIQAKQNIEFMGQVQELPYLNYSTSSQPPLILSLGNEAQFSMYSEQDIIFQNIVAPGGLFVVGVNYFRQANPNIQVVSNNNILFNNIHSTDDLIYVGYQFRNVVFQAGGAIQFSYILTHYHLFNVLSNSALQFSANKTLSFVNIGGYSQARLETLVLIGGDNANVSLSSKGLLSFTNISAIQSTENPYNCLLVDSANYSQTVFQLLSQTGIFIQTNQENQTNYNTDSKIQNYNLQWVYPSDGLFLSCLANCQVCQNSQICTTCKSGTVLSSDKKKCQPQSISTKQQDLNTDKKFLEPQSNLIFSLTD